MERNLTRYTIITIIAFFINTFILIWRLGGRRASVSTQARQGSWWGEESFARVATGGGEAQQHEWSDSLLRRQTRDGRTTGSSGLP